MRFETMANATKKRMFRRILAFTKLAFANIRVNSNVNLYI